MVTINSIIRVDQNDYGNVTQPIEWWFHKKSISEIDLLSLDINAPTTEELRECNVIVTSRVCPIRKIKLYMEWKGQSEFNYIIIEYLHDQVKSQANIHSKSTWVYGGCGAGVERSRARSRFLMSPMMSRWQTVKCLVTCHFMAVY